MGNNLTCNETWCFKQVKFTCCELSFCEDCLLTHMQTESQHLAKSVSTPLQLVALKYHTPDFRTLVFEALYKSKPHIAKVQYCSCLSEVNKRQEEAALQRSLRHPNICRCLKSYIEGQAGAYKLVILMERGLSDLETEVHKRSAKADYWTEEEWFKHTSALVDAFALMQRHNLVHRDVKPGNILVFKGGLLKICDFGLSIEGEETISSCVLNVAGTANYFSPKLKEAYDDIWKGNNKDAIVSHNPFKSDVYSLGLTLLQMATLRVPKSLNSSPSKNFTLKQRIQTAVTRIYYSEKAKSLLKAMLEIDEAKRLDFLQLREWLKDLDSESEEETQPQPIVTKSETSPSKLDTTQETESFESFSECLENLSEDLQSLCLKVVNNTSKALRWFAPTENKWLSKVLVNMEHLEVLELNNCELQSQGMELLQPAFAHLTKLRLLALNQNHLGPCGAYFLALALDNLSELRILRLWGNNLGKKGIKSLSAALNNLDSLSELYLAENEIGSEGAKYLVDSLPGNLEILSLNENTLQDLGARFLSEGLRKLFSLKKLYLENNKIGNIGANYIAKNLPGSLTVLRLNRNFLTSEITQVVKELKPRIKIQI